MIKGIYNENEFYTNFYWDSKFLEDLRSKVGEDASTNASVAALKGLDAQFWAMKEMSEGGTKQLEAMADFYKSLFQALGYRPETKEHQTSAGQAYSHFVDVKRSTAPELFAVLVDQPEMGAFETPPVLLNFDANSEVSPVDCELSEVLREELQDSQNPPRWILVGAPNALFIIERNKWSFGRYLRIEWQEIFLQRDAKPYEVLYGLAAQRTLCPKTGNSPHDEFDDNSHRHAFEVTTELRESVREAIELLINEMIDLKKESHQKIYSPDAADEYAKELTHDALYYVYRLLFLLYLEAQGNDSDLLPLKSEIYRNGYSLEKLLELDLVDVAPDSMESRGTFLYESLDQIFSLIFYGFEPGAKDGIFKTEHVQSGFLVKGIKSDLFDSVLIKHLKSVKLRNGVLLEILKKLSLTRKKERGGKPRARVSYANLGINQLGAVYEGLLSYTGFFAQEDLHALKASSVKQSDIDNGKDLDQVYLAPKSLVEKYRKISEKKYRLSDENTVLDESGNPKIYKKGSFIYRLAGRDRQRLASYYTPESLTKCTVKYSLKVLFEAKKTLEDLWRVKILEPAMGSGAFLNESVNQLADKILELEVKQGVGDLLTPKSKQKRLWAVKWHLIANNVYGVDLNPTAIELARFSLWLNCIGAGKGPPTFDGRLKVGNSLIGARFKKGADGIYPWLLLEDGMLSPGKRLRDLDSEASSSIEVFRKTLFASRLQGNDRNVRHTQEIAGRCFAESISKSQSPSGRDGYRQRLKFAANLWCSYFFCSADRLKSIPRTHADLLQQMEKVLNGETLSPECVSTVLRIAESENFFHWDLEFPEILQDGGFDLILGNPPWVGVSWDDAGYLSDINPVASVLELSSPDTREFIESLDDKAVGRRLGRELIRVSGYVQMLEIAPYGLLKGVNKNTYKCFDVIALEILREFGALGFIQEDGILEDEETAQLREQLFQQLRFHFRFVNDFLLFSEVSNRKQYSVNIFSGTRRCPPDFFHIGNLFIPSTVESCFNDDGSSLEVPGIKTVDNNWDTRGHKNRIVRVDQKALTLFAKLGNSKPASPALLNLHSESFVSILERLAANSVQLVDYVGADDLVGSRMLNEASSQDNKLIQKNSGKAKTFSKVIYSGPNIEAFNPLAQETKAEYRSNRSYDRIDLEKIQDDFIPRTLFQLACSVGEIEKSMAQTRFKDRPYSHFYRIATRDMIHPTNERCLFTAIVPPGLLHIDGISSIAIGDHSKLAVCSGFCGSLIADAFVRFQNSGHFHADDFRSVSLGTDDRFYSSIARRSLALNCLTNAYAPLWEVSTPLENGEDSLLGGRRLTGFGRAWNRDWPLRNQLERTAAVVEIDVLVSLTFGISVGELFQIYDVMFPVLAKKDRDAKINRKEMMASAFEYFERRGW